MADDQLDDVFLADLTGFLNEFGALVGSTELQGEEQVEKGANDLLLDSHKLLAETEALLMSCGTLDDGSTIQKPSQVTTTKKCFGGLETQSEDDKRREIRNKQATKRRLKYRTKLKSERQALKEEEKALSAELESLQQARKKPKSLKERSVAMPVWRAITTRQMEGRLVAEAQQRRLKRAVENRAKLIKELGGMLQQRVYGSNALICVDSKMSTRENAVQFEPDDTVLYEEYLHDMDVVYARTDEVFSEYGVEKTPQVSFKMEPQWKKDGDVEYFDNLDVLLIPFSYKQTCTAMWKAMQLIHSQKDRRHYAGVTDPENTVAVKFRIPCPRESAEPVVMLFHLVMRRYVEADRMVIVWRALSEGQDEFSGMHSDETGWCVVRPVKPEGDEVPAMPTIMQTFVRFIPMRIGDEAGSQQDVGKFTKLVIVSGEEDGLEVARMMESLMLNDSQGK